jgi:tetratricopeptide (TPR) repeat protein
MSENDPEAQKLVVEVKVARAVQAVGQGQIDLAVEDLTLLRDQNPSSAQVRLGLARAQIARRNADGALAELTKAVEIDPKSAEARYQLGYVNLVMKARPAAALPPLEQAVALEPGNVGYRTTLGAALNANQSFDRAIAELSKVTRTAGYDKPEGFVYLGQAYVGAKKYKEAVATLEKATTLAPKNDQAWAFLGWAYFGLKDGPNFTRAAGKARSLGYKEATLLQYLTRVESGEPIK